MGHVAQIKKEVVAEVIAAKVDLRCHVDGCEEEFVRSVHLKRHLTGVHMIQNPLLAPEHQHHSEEPKTEVRNEDKAEKVPPLKIKLNQNDNSKPEELNNESDEEERELLVEISDIPMDVIINEINGSPAVSVEY